MLIKDAQALLAAINRNIPAVRYPMLLLRVLTRAAFADTPYWLLDY